MSSTGENRDVYLACPFPLGASELRELLRVVAQLLT